MRSQPEPEQQAPGDGWDGTPSGGPTDSWRLVRGTGERVIGCAKQILSSLEAEREASSEGAA